MNAAVAHDVRFGELQVARYVFLKKDLAARWGKTNSQITRWLQDGTLPPCDVFDAAGQPLGWSPICIEMFELANPRFREMAFPVVPPE